MAWPWRGVFGVPAPGVFPWVVLFLCCAFGRLSIFDLEAGARTGLNANDPAWAAGIGNLALRAHARDPAGVPGVSARATAMDLA